MRCKLLTVVLFVAWLALPAGCTYTTTSYPYIEIDPSLELVFSYRYRELILIGANGEEPVGLGESEYSIITPRFSPAGNRIACFDLGTTGLPTSTTIVSMQILTLATPSGDIEWLTAPLPQFNADNRLVIHDVVPPLWHPSGAYVLFAHARGIHRVRVDGRVDVLVEARNVLSMAFRPGAWELAYTTRENAYMIELEGRGPEKLLADDFVQKFTTKYPRAIAFSPDGAELAFAVGDQIGVVQLETRQARKFFEAPGAVYWLSWVPGTDQVVFLSGQEKRTATHLGPWYQDVEGDYRLGIVRTNGRE
jgi:hypothetical protein